jgi:hypothetical protein
MKPITLANNLLKKYNNELTRNVFRTITFQLRKIEQLEIDLIKAKKEADNTIKDFIFKDIKPLTDDEIYEIWQDTANLKMKEAHYRFAKAIELKARGYIEPKYRGYK